MTEMLLLSASLTIKDSISLVFAILMASAFVIFLLTERKKENPMIFEKGMVLAILIFGFTYVFQNILY